MTHFSSASTNKTILAVGADLAEGWQRYLQDDGVSFVPVGLHLSEGPTPFEGLLSALGSCDLILFSHVLLDVAMDAGGIPAWFWPTLDMVQPHAIVLCLERFVECVRSDARVAQWPCARPPRAVQVWPPRDKDLVVLPITHSK